MREWRLLLTKGELMLRLAVLGACVLGFAFSSAASAAPDRCSNSNEFVAAQRALTLAKSNLAGSQKAEADCAKQGQVVKCSFLARTQKAKEDCWKSCPGWQNSKLSPAAMTRQANAIAQAAELAYMEAKRRCSASN